MRNQFNFKHMTTIKKYFAPVLVLSAALLLLSCGTGAWRVRSSMNEIAEALGLVCAADIGLLSIEYTCSDGENTFAQTLTLTATGIDEHDEDEQHQRDAEQ